MFWLGGFNPIWARPHDRGSLWRAYHMHEETIARVTAFGGVADCVPWRVAAAGVTRITVATWSYRRGAGCREKECCCLLLLLVRFALFTVSAVRG